MKLEQKNAMQRIYRFVNVIADTFIASDVGVDGRSLKALCTAGHITKVTRGNPSGRKDRGNRYRLCDEKHRYDTCGRDNDTEVKQ